MKKFLAMVVVVLLLAVFSCSTVFAASVLTAGDYEETDANITWTAAAPWQIAADAAFFGGSCVYSDEKGSTFEFTYDGGSATLFGNTHNMYGMMEVSVDGGEPVLVDCYATDCTPATGSKELYTINQSGQHTVKVTISSTKNEASAGNYVAFDRVTIAAAGATTTENPTTGDASMLIYLGLAAASGAGLVVSKLSRK